MEQKTVKSGGGHLTLMSIMNRWWWDCGSRFVLFKARKTEAAWHRLGSHLARFGMPHDLHNLATCSPCILCILYHIVYLQRHETLTDRVNGHFEPRNGCPTFGPLGALCRLDAQHWALFRFCWSNLPIMEVNTRPPLRKISWVTLSPTFIALDPMIVHPGLAIILKVGFFSPSISTAGRWRNLGPAKWRQLPHRLTKLVGWIVGVGAIGMRKEIQKVREWLPFGPLWQFDNFIFETFWDNLMIGWHNASR